MRAGSLDAELAALLWLWLEARLPLLVAAGPQLGGKSATLAALLDFLPSDTRRIFLRGQDEEFDWLPEAAGLGWPRPPGWIERLPDEADAVGPSSVYLLVNELSSHLPAYTWGERARVAVRAAGYGYGLAGTLHATALEGVFDELQGPSVGASEDEVRALGIVLIVGVVGADSRDGSPTRRVVAAHYLRPIERDQGGHVQRRPPAVLATWDRQRDTFDHFEWALADELSARMDRSPRDFERERVSRVAYLTRLVETGTFDPDEVAQAIHHYHHMTDRAAPAASSTPTAASTPASSFARPVPTRSP